MPLRSEPVSQCLEKKLLILGFEVPDVLAIFLLLSILNFLFGQTQSKLLLVWLPVVAIAIALRIGKRGKPDNYLIHLAQHHAKPKYYSAFIDSKEIPSPPHLKRKKQ